MSRHFPGVTALQRHNACCFYSVSNLNQETESLTSKLMTAAHKHLFEEILKSLS